MQPKCPTCLDLEGHNGKEYVEVQEVARRRKEGCPGCDVVSWALEPYFEQVLQQGYEVRLYINGHAWINYAHDRHGSSAVRNTPKTMELKISGVPKRTPGTSVFYPELHDACPWRSIEATPMISGHTGSAEAVACAKSWLNECSTRHPTCQIGSSQLPTRVLEVRGPNEIKLYETSAGEAGDYVALSHCWGKHQIITTTTVNLADHKVSVPWDKLPRTFREAAIFTYSLGLKYIWIDSLCILQDSVEDWRNEGSRMASIYESSYVTVAATKSSDSSQGCFVYSQERKVSRRKTFLNSTNQSYEIHCYEPLPLCIEIPLQTRGWVLQERVLPKRLIHFVEQELYWECNTLSACECSAAPRACRIPGPESRTTIRGKWDVHAEVQNAKSAQEIGELWAEIVEEYTQRALTYSSDIFPAIQGVAKVVSSAMGRYLAGHWEDTLPQSLSWYVESDTLRLLKATQKMEWRAPSWSWAAAAGAVRWGRNTDAGSQESKSFATVTSAQIVPKGVDPAGELSSGKLVLKGRCLEAVITAGEYGDPKLCIIEGESNGQPDLWWPGCYPCWDRKDGAKPGMRVTVMKVNERDAGEKEYWLVLKTADQKTFKRIGLLVVDNYHHADLDIPFVFSKEHLDELYASRSAEMEMIIV